MDPKRLTMLRYRIVLVCTVGLSALGAEAAHGQPAATDFHRDPLPPGAVARLGTVRFRHPTSVVFASFLPDGKSVLSVSEDGILCVWEFPSGKESHRLETLAGPKATVVSATLSPNGKHLVASGDDGLMRIWDWADARELGKVASVAKTPKTLKSSSLLTRLRSNATPAGQVYSPDNKTLLLFGASRVLQLVDLPSGKEIGPSVGHTDALISIKFTRDGGQILTGDEHTTRTWDPATGKGLGTLPITLPPTPGTPTIISPDGRIGVTVARFTTALQARAAAEREAVLFDTANGQQLGTIALVAESGAIHRKPLVFSPDSKVLAANLGDAQQKINLYDVRNGKLLRTLEAGPGAQPARGKAVIGAVIAGGPGGFGALATSQMLFAPDGNLLAFQAAPGAKIVVLNTGTGKQIASVSPDENSPAMHGAFSPDGRCLALEQSDGTVTLFELASGKPRDTFGSKFKLGPSPSAQGVLLEDLLLGSVVAKTSTASFAIAPDAKLLAVSGPAGLIHVWDVWTGKELAVFKGHTAAVNALEFAPTGKTLASASSDTTALIWDMTRVVRPPLPAKALEPGDLEKLWQTLARDDASQAVASMRDLAAAPNEATAWIKERVKPAAPLDMKRVQELLTHLDDSQFKVRAKATAELLQIGALVLPVIDKALAGSTSQEARQRLEQVRGVLTGVGLQGDRLRDFRAVEVLELIGTPQARQVLQALAGGAPDALVTTSAQAVLKR
jgi:WD40 repeat protein